MKCHPCWILMLPSGILSLGNSITKKKTLSGITIPHITVRVFQRSWTKFKTVSCCCSYICFATLYALETTVSPKFWKGEIRKKLVPWRSFRWVSATDIFQRGPQNIPCQKRLCKIKYGFEGSILIYLRLS